MSSTVVFIDHGQALGGSGVSLAVALEAIGSRVRRVLAIPPGRTMDLADRSGGIDRHVVMPPLRTSSVAGALSILRAGTRVLVATRGEPVRAVHANGLLDLFVAVPLAAVRRVPVVVWLHDADVEDRKVSRALPIVNRLVPVVRWAAVSNAAADNAARARLASRGEISVIPNPIQAARVARRSRSLVTIGYLGSDSERKGFDLLPWVARSLDPDVARLLVFAKKHSGIPPELQRTWSELELERSVEIRGRVDDVSAAYAECDVVICPSRTESFCRVAAEAMLNGVPVVGSDIPAVREVLDDGRAGVLFTAGDAAALSSAVESLVGDARRRAELGEAGREHAQQFRPEHVARLLLAAYGVRSDERSVAALDVGRDP